jgi:cysteine desulfurase
LDQTVYLDNGATTQVAPEVAALAAHAMTVAYGNPSSRHRLGAEAARLIAEARERVARAFSCTPQEIFFTSGGTEANALAVLGAAASARGKHVVITAIEHPSVVECARELEERGFEVARAQVAPHSTPTAGLVDLAALTELVRTDTALVSVLWVQNEIGSVQPVDAIARAVKRKAPRCQVHIDAVQAAGKIAIDLTDASFDSLSVSAHKLHGPKGTGALWLRKGARVKPLAFGGGQESGVRPGTEGVPGIAAFGLALELAERSRQAGSARSMAALRDQLRHGISTRAPKALRIGPTDLAHAAPHILSIGFPGVPAEPLLHALEARGVLVSSGSACHSRSKKPSAVLQALGVADDVGTIRFSLSRLTTEADIARAVDATSAALAELAT